MTPKTPYRIVALDGCAGILKPARSVEDDLRLLTFGLTAILANLYPMRYIRRAWSKFTKPLSSPNG